MKNQTKLLPLLFIAVMMISVGCGTQVPAGHGGVFFSKFGGGTELGKTYPEGFAWHLPWNSMNVYSLKLQENKEKLTVLSSDGASIILDVSIRYKLRPDKLDSLHVGIGRNYYAIAISPSIRGIGRGVAGNYTPEEIYSTKRDEMAAAIVTGLQEAVDDKFIIIEAVIMRNVTLPPKISEAIDFKLAAAQEAQRMKFTIEKERREAERKRIEAQGIADFQKIISAGITPSYLKWKGIETTEKLASSPNSKVIIIGNSASSLPIILSAE